MTPQQPADAFLKAPPQPLPRSESLLLLLLGDDDTLTSEPRECVGSHATQPDAPTSAAPASAAPASVVLVRVFMCHVYVCTCVHCVCSVRVHECVDGCTCTNVICICVCVSVHLCV